MAVLEHTRRFARHLLLVEIGEAGQARLCAARVRVAAAADPRVAAVAREYLVRAGAVVSSALDATRGIASSSDVRERADEPALELAVLDARGIRDLAGRPELEEAAAALAGAFAAVEAIKRAVGAGTPAALPAGLRLSGEVSV